MKKEKQEQAVVLSVSIQKGCYRHIQVSVDDTLEELADAILYSFDFENDHAHAFFMDNKVWSGFDCYYMAEVDEDGEYRHTCDYRIARLKLNPGDAFKFVFDFGDEWIFQCKVLRIVEAEDEDALLIRSVGAPPEQYPSDEDFEEEE